MASATGLKEQGNKAFAEGNYKEADRFYTRAIQRDPTDPVFFTNRAFTRVKLQAWDDCMTDALKALDLFAADDKPTRIKMKAYYYLALAQLARQRPGEGLCSAQRAYEMAVALERADAETMANLVMRAKKEKWEVAEGERLRRASAVLRDVEDALRMARERAEAELEERAAEMTTSDDESDEYDDDQVEAERQTIRVRCDEQVRAVRAAFAAADPAKLGRREVPDYLIDRITFGVMLDPVVTPHGHSYERHTIEAHLRASPTDPLTREKLSVRDLRPNIALRLAAEEFIAGNGWAVDW